MRSENKNIKINPVTDKIRQFQLGGWFLSFFVLTGFLYYDL